MMSNYKQNSYNYRNHALLEYLDCSKEEFFLGGIWPLEKAREMRKKLLSYSKTSSYQQKPNVSD